MNSVKGRVALHVHIPLTPVNLRLAASPLVAALALAMMAAPGRAQQSAATPASAQSTSSDEMRLIAQEAYIYQVYQLAKFFRLSPDKLSEPQVRQYLFHLAHERKLAASTVNQAVNAFRFFYRRVLHRDLQVLRQALPHGRKSIRRRRFYGRRRN